MIRRSPSPPLTRCTSLHNRVEEMHANNLHEMCRNISFDDDNNNTQRKRSGSLVENLNKTAAVTTNVIKSTAAFLAFRMYHIVNQQHDTSDDDIPIINTHDLLKFMMENEQVWSEFSEYVYRSKMITSMGINEVMHRYIRERRDVLYYQYHLDKKAQSQRTEEMRKSQQQQQQQQSRSTKAFTILSTALFRRRSSAIEDNRPGLLRRTRATPASSSSMRNEEFSVITKAASSAAIVPPHTPRRQTSIGRLFGDGFRVRRPDENCRHFETRNGQAKDSHEGLPTTTTSLEVAAVPLHCPPNNNQDDSSSCCTKSRTSSSVMKSMTRMGMVEMFLPGSQTTTQSENDTEMLMTDGRRRRRRRRRRPYDLIKPSSPISPEYSSLRRLGTNSKKMYSHQLGTNFKSGNKLRSDSSLASLLQGSSTSLSPTPSMLFSHFNNDDFAWAGSMTVISPSMPPKRMSEDLSARWCYDDRKGLFVRRSDHVLSSR